MKLPLPFGLSLRIRVPAENDAKVLIAGAIAALYIVVVGVYTFTDVEANEKVLLYTAGLLISLLVGGATAEVVRQKFSADDSDVSSVFDTGESGGGYDHPQPRRRPREPPDYYEPPRRRRDPLGYGRRRYYDDYEDYPERPPRRRERDRDRTPTRQDPNHDRPTHQREHEHETAEESPPSRRDRDREGERPRPDADADADDATDAESDGGEVE